MQIAEWPSGLSLRDDPVNDRPANAFDRCQAVADRSAGYGKAGFALIDIRRQERDLHAPAGQDITGHLGGKINDGSHQGRHKFRRIIIFEPGCLVSDHRVTGRVGLVEGVFGEIHHHIVDMGGCILRDASGNTAGDIFFRIAVYKVAALLFHDRLLLFTHGPADQVAPSQSIAAQVPDNGHDLLLIDNTAIGRGQDRFQLGAVISNMVRVVLAFNIFGDKVHGTRPVQGDSRDDVLQAAGLQFLHKGLHARAFQLEDALRMACAQRSQNCLVIIVNGFHTQGVTCGIFPHFPGGHPGLSGRIAAAGGLYGAVGHPDRVLDDRQGPQAQKVHFQKSQLLDGGHGELGGHGTVLGPGQGDQVLRRFRTDHDAGRVDRAVAGQSLQTPGHVDQFADPLILFIGTLQLRVHLQGFFQGHAQFRRDHLGDGIHKAVGQIHDPSHVPYDTFGQHGTECDDLHDPVPAVFTGHVIDDLLSAFETEVHVNIRHGDTFRIQETLEEQVVTDRIDIRDTQAVGNDGTCRRPSSGPDHDPVLPGVIDIVPYDQEVIDIAHLPDGIQLKIQPVPQGPVVFRIALRHAVIAEFVQVSPGIITFRYIKTGEPRHAEFDLDIAAAGDLLRILQRFPGIGEQRPHFRFAL